MSVIDITLKGRPATKKNSGRIISRNGKPIIIPSEAYKNYEDACRWQLAGKKLHVSGIIVVECKYYLPNKRSWTDLIGLLQATSDTPYLIQKGDRLVQGILVPVGALKLLEVAQLTETVRGTGGIGSTGK